jgi:hypothetical protein
MDNNQHSPKRPRLGLVPDSFLLKFDTSPDYARASFKAPEVNILLVKTVSGQELRRISNWLNLYGEHPLPLFPGSRFETAPLNPDCLATIISGWWEIYLAFWISRSEEAQPRGAPVGSQRWIKRISDKPHYVCHNQVGYEFSQTAEIIEFARQDPTNLSCPAKSLPYLKSDTAVERHALIFIPIKRDTPLITP